jgi:GNAT superfamily N-acetyltransferase
MRSPTFHEAPDAGPIPAGAPVVRPLRPADAAACSALVRACIERDSALPAALRAELAQGERPETMLERARLYYVAVCAMEGRPAGVGAIDWNEIRMLCVAPDLQRRGIGSLMLQHLEAMVPPALFREIFVYASPSASGFYARNGYEARGRHAFRIDRYEIETVFMVKRLSGSAP